MNEIETSKAFQERVFEKIRADIGNLMTDAELKSLLNAAMQKAFFEPVIVKDGYGYVRNENPPLIVSMTEDLMKARVQSAIDKWVEEHPDEIRKIIERVLVEGITGAIARYFQMRFEAPLDQLRADLEEKGLIPKRY